MQTRIATLFVLIFTLASHAFADVQLPGIISDHMLLQRDMPVRISAKPHQANQSPWCSAGRPCER
jgi:hypothetical protein